jgi:hypothetical protein
MTIQAIDPPKSPFLRGTLNYSLKRGTLNYSLKRGTLNYSLKRGTLNYSLKRGTLNYSPLSKGGKGGSRKLRLLTSNLG